MGTRLIIEWELPTTRQPSGRPLAVEDIAEVIIELSADGGANFVVLGEFPPSVLTTEVSDLADGDWLVRGTCVDTRGKASDPPALLPVPIDTDAPGAVTLRFTLE